MKISLRSIDSISVANFQPLLPVLGVLAVALTSTQRSVAATLQFQPIPDPQSIGMFISSPENFDSSTGAYSVSGPVLAVQFPELQISYSDPLVASGALLTEQGTFTGTSLNPNSLPTTGKFFLTTTLTLNGSLISREDSVLTFSGFVTSGDVTYESWKGSIDRASWLFDPTVITSPFIDQLARARDNGATGETYESSTTQSGAPTQQKDYTSSPEPNLFPGVAFALTVLLLVVRSRKRTSYRPPPGSTNFC